MSFWDFFKQSICSRELNTIKDLKDANIAIGLANKSLSEEIDKLKKDWNSLFESNNDLQEIINSLTMQLNSKTFVNELPSCFERSTKNYKGNAFVSTKRGDFEWTYKKASDGLALSPFMDEMLEKAKIKETDSAKQVFDKILGVEQKFVNYLLDVNQYGKGEVWNQPFFEWVTKASDCESSAMRVVSCFEYYQLKYGRFIDAFAFVGTGLFQKQFGHGFPCLLVNENDLMNGLFVGEATLNAVIPSRELKLVKENYDLSWGAFSFWHNFFLKEELKWWK